MSRSRHALRPLLTTRLFERDTFAIAPEMEARFRQDLADRGVTGASLSERIASQVAPGESPVAPTRESPVAPTRESPVASTRERPVTPTRERVET